MEHIKTELNKYLKRNGLYKMAESSNICNIFESTKEKFLSNDIKCKALSFKEGILKLAVSSSIASTEVKLRREEIKKELNKNLKEDRVKRIDVIIKS